jgi:hypothetical protein
MSFLFKGIKLADHFFSAIEMLNDDYINNEKYVSFMDLLFNQLIYCNIDQIRKNLLSLFNKIFRRFGRVGRFKFLAYYLNKSKTKSTTNNYISSYLIWLFKEEINECFNENNLDFYQINSNLNFKRLFNLVFTLSQSIETDLLDESSRILSTLNCLRFLLIRDRQANKTSIYTLLKKSTYMHELEKALEFSKAHYKLEIDRLKQDHTTNVNNNIDIQIEANELSAIPCKQDQIFALENAFGTLDLIESLRIRINELLNHGEF